MVQMFGECPVEEGDTGLLLIQNATLYQVTYFMGQGRGYRTGDMGGVQKNSGLSCFAAAYTENITSRSCDPSLIFR